MLRCAYLLTRVDRPYIITSRTSTHTLIQHPELNAHVYPTLCAIQTLTTQNALDRIDVELVTNFLLSLQLPSDAFSEDRFGEADTRFLHCSVNALSLLGQLCALPGDGPGRRGRAIAHIVQCRNFDGGFGTSPVRRVMLVKDPDEGGIADRPNNAVVVFHTHFRCAVLITRIAEPREDLDPVYCIPARVTEKLCTESVEGIAKERDMAMTMLQYLDVWLYVLVQFV
ncbi:terpenoid cyclases/Protein prenyltransferase [Fomitiporia mediterranea MF3/22]|uniref:terpenoid cyclases/Protein prenyltransferase n=1 Tax=Fomitiporia mediterranea (strain MF3/22) TaxID=694068 RepID=UPI000440985D|nr:terpenoid cyclases/Protein prenyltransferase [Fomitiporia mediterranea MF3/22]EJC99533.1 terpenoid cyclases/Protein prenyltransferase [Fomitiporia mediterranea MF3/22]